MKYTYLIIFLMIACNKVNCATDALYERIVHLEIKSLYDKDSQVSKKEIEPLIQACQSGDLTKIKSLIKNSEEELTKWALFQDVPYSPLEALITHNKSNKAVNEFLSNLISSGNIKIQNSAWRSALYSNNDFVLKILLNNISKMSASRELEKSILYFIYAMLNSKKIFGNFDENNYLSTLVTLLYKLPSDIKSQALGLRELQFKVPDPNTNSFIIETEQNASLLEISIANELFLTTRALIILGASLPSENDLKDLVAEIQEKHEIEAELIKRECILIQKKNKCVICNKETTRGCLECKIAYFCSKQCMDFDLRHTKTCLETKKLTEKIAELRKAL